MLAPHTFGDDGASVDIVVDLPHGLAETELDGRGRVQLDQESSGYRWWRVLRPGDEPIR